MKTLAAARICQADGMKLRDQKPFMTARLTGESLPHNQARTPSTGASPEHLPPRQPVTTSTRQMLRQHLRQSSTTPHREEETPQLTTEERNGLLSEAVRIGSHVVVSHVTAWRLHDMHVPAELTDEKLHVSVRDGARRVRRSGVRCYRRTTRPDLVDIDGVPVTSPEQTWVDLAQLKPTLVTHVALGDALVGGSMRKLMALQSFVYSTHSSRGVRLSRRALSLVRLGAESVKETETRLRIVDAGLPEPELNLNLYDRNGMLLGRGDMVYRKARVVVEYDGAHHGREAVRRRDASRRNAFQHAGWRMITLPQGSLNDPDQEWLRQLRHYLMS